jgi:RNA polymerase sigma-70 factor (ECF subfamily)
MMNGLPALVIEFADQSPREAVRIVQRCEIGPDGCIKELHSILASRKLTAVRFALGGSHDPSLGLR